MKKPHVSGIVAGVYLVGAAPETILVPVSTARETILLPVGTAEETSFLAGGTAAFPVKNT